MTEAQPSEAEKPLDAIVTRVKSFDSGWAILSVERAGMPETWVGMAPDLKEGMPVRATGEWVKHDKFGSQFKFASLIVKMPDAADPGALATFLSRLVPGIGIRMTTHLVEALGADTIPALERNAYDLIGAVKGIRGKHADEHSKALCEEWQKHSVEGQLIVQLARFGIRGSVAKKVVKKYGGRAAQMVAEHPYILAMEVDGIGFKTADVIAKSVGIPHDSTVRMEAGLLYTFEEKVSSRGHCYVYRESLFDHAATLLEIGDGPLSDGLAAGVESGRFILEGATDNPQIYLAALHRAEVRVAARLARLLTAPAILRIRDGMPLDDMDFEGEDDPAPLREEAPAAEVLAQHAEKAILSFEKQKGMTLAPLQKEAVRLVMREKVFVLTGSPGCGKTSTLLAIISALESAGFDIAMCAPTGMASKRMAQATGRQATTIHRLLGFNPEMGFTKNAANRLSQSVVICDESSMVTTSLAASLLEAVDDGARFIFVGDVDQLPSIGAGAVLRDVIESEAVPVVRLTQIFRQAEGSRIITNAHRVNRGEMPEKPTGVSDFFWVERNDAEKAANTVIEVVTTKMAGRGFSARDCMVISPQRRGAVGINALNARLQEALNPSGPCITFGKAPHQTIFREGDRVMQTKNDYEREVFNGDTGWIKSVDADKKTMLVRVDERDVLYEKKHFEHVSLAYACTGHKMQGGQSKVIVVVMLREHFMLLSRPWLYTSLTRSEKFCVLIADTAAVATALSETKRELRNTGLKERLRRAVGKES